jgi:hypothetical protein
MKLLDLMKLAEKAYDIDETIGLYYNPETGDRVKNNAGGDLLAAFIVEEIFETFNSGETDENQLIEARRVIDRAADQLNAVSGAFLHAEFSL